MWLIYWSHRRRIHGSNFLTAVTYSTQSNSKLYVQKNNYGPNPPVELAQCHTYLFTEVSAIHIFIHCYRLPAFFGGNGRQWLPAMVRWKCRIGVTIFVARVSRLVLSIADAISVLVLLDGTFQRAAIYRCYDGVTRCFKTALQMEPIASFWYLEKMM